MYENSHSWRKRLRLQRLVALARKEIASGRKLDDISLVLEQEMQVRWRLAATTRRQYLIIISKVLSNKFVLTPNV
ncbi:MAG: hypothetical protein KC483_05405 [Nitrosarchaeum sp.]|nr:hypothetical protein [Nitrosarchaeum sp.]